MLHFHMEDGSITILEPRKKNSGIPQGVIVKRHRIPNVKPDVEYYGLEDIQIGRTISIYGKDVKIVDAEEDSKVFQEFQPMLTPTR
jgi:hypothetical protein